MAYPAQMMESGTAQKSSIYILIPWTAIDCVCTEGQTYFTVDKYDGKNNREKDEIQFEFKTSQLSGLVMYAGGTRDSIEVAYKEGNVFMFNTNLGRGMM